MEPRINEGDYVIARKSCIADNGDVVVCVNNQKALIKKFKKQNGSVILTSLNPKYDPFIAAPDFRIEGVVRGVYSNVL